MFCVICLSLISVSIFFVILNSSQELEWNLFIKKSVWDLKLCLTGSNLSHSFGRWLVIACELQLVGNLARDWVVNPKFTLSFRYSKIFFTLCIEQKLFRFSFVIYATEVVNTRFFYCILILLIDSFMGYLFVVPRFISSSPFICIYWCFITAHVNF